MVFSSTLFLFLFLPVVLILNFLLKKEFRNFFLLISSLAFYFWGEGVLVVIMVTSICINYIFGAAIHYFQKKALINASKIVLFLAVIANLSILVYYKYFGFIAENLAYLNLVDSLTIPTILLPIGISFFTFQSLSYCVDVYRKDVAYQKNPLDLGLYIALFPQLIAGPIVRYIDIEKQLKGRWTTRKDFACGIEQFIRGLSKKIIFANTAAIVADATFAIEASQIPTSIAWLGILSYSLQIYFDFSGYSDMALGLGRMFGFNFPINFNYPYISKSIQEFWRRWHISLSTWFRDYLYFPLGGSRAGNFKTYRNLFIVFLATGIWHGASWNFVVWGLFHGFFIILERIGLNKFLQKTYTIIPRIYTLAVVIFGWVFFRSEDISYSFDFIKSLLGISSGSNYSPLLEVDNYIITALLLGVLFSMPVRPYLSAKLNKLEVKINVQNNKGYSYLKYSLLSLLFFLTFIFCTMQIANNSYNPFIYFRF